LFYVAKSGNKWYVIAINGRNARIIKEINLMKDLIMNPYMIMAFLGGIACLATQYFNFAQEGYPFKKRLQVVGLTFVCIMAGVGSSILGYWQNAGIFMLPPSEWFEHIGLTAYHGMIAAWLSFCLGSRILGINISTASSIAAPCIVIFFAFGRVGCSLVGCCYGKPAHFKFLGHEFFTFPTAQLEVVFFLSLFIALLFFIKKHRSIITILSYSIFRFFNEFLRGDDRGTMIPGIPLSPAQTISLSIIIILAVGFTYSGIKNKFKKHCLTVENNYSKYKNGGEI
jgi:phosphatidylglycerol:prolipoprotein diacylglycerol transferase